MTAHIVYYNYLTPDGNAMSIGGIQTYLTNLFPIITDLGYKIKVYQRSNRDFCKKINGIEIYGIGYTNETWGTSVSKHLIKRAIPLIDCTQDFLIYGCETCITQRIECPTIAIQHGIFWDIEDKTPMSTLKYMKATIRRLQNSWNVTNRVTKVDRLVCVDHNFVNWHRAMCVNTNVNHIVIPNFSEIPDKCAIKGDSPIKIIFARRFFVHRGTRLFTNAILRILKEHKGIEVIIAGDGPDAAYIHNHLDPFENVRFVKYESHESLKIHEDKHIAVIPTTGSEGTSLSLLEAMAAGCAVICTNVGGMTNIVLDHYNGIIINPDEESLYHALCLLIEDVSLRKTLQSNAYDTAKHAFSIDIWKERWKKVITSLR